MSKTKLAFRCMALLFLGYLAGLSARPQLGSAQSNNMRLKKYQKAMVFSGGGFQTAMFLGMLEGAEISGHRPDVIIGACGGGMAAGIAHALQQNKDRYDFVTSREFFELMRRPYISNGSLYSAVYNLGSMVRKRMGLSDGPNMFAGPVMSVPQTLGVPLYDQYFISSGMRVVILAGELETEQGPSGITLKSGPKPIKQVFFTDSETARLLYGFQSAVARTFPGSFIDYETKVITGKTLGQAGRAGISDPYYINPMVIDGKYYVTGGVDLYPIEVAKRLGEEVTMVYPSSFDPIVESNFFAGAFGYSANARRFNVINQYAHHWIDASDVTDALYDKAGFNPKPVLREGMIVGQVPEDYEEFKRRIHAQWVYGRQRAIESFNRPLNDKLHIRHTTLQGQIAAVLEASRNSQKHK